MNRDENDDSSSSHYSDKIKTCDTDNDYCMQFLLSNARSLSPKMDLLLDGFGCLQLQFAAITETWFKGGEDLRGILLILRVHQASGSCIRAGVVYKRNGVAGLHLPLTRAPALQEKKYVGCGKEL